MSTQRNPQQLAEACADAMYANDPASQAMGIALQSVAPGRTTMTMTVRENMLNGHGICHGGFIFTLADSAFAFACNSHNHNTVAAGARIDFLAPARLEDQLTAVAAEVFQRGKTGVYDVQVNNQQGEPVAVFRGNSHRVPGQLVDESSRETGN